MPSLVYDDEPKSNSIVWDDEVSSGKQGLQDSYDRSKAGFGERVSHAAQNRMSQAQIIANQAANGDLVDNAFLDEGALRTGLKLAQIGPDIAGEAAVSAFRAIPDSIETPIRQGASNVYSAVANSPIGDLAGSAVQGYQSFAKNHPLAASRIGSVFDAGNLTSSFVPIKGTSTVGAIAAPTEKALVATGKSLAPVVNAARPTIRPEALMLEDKGIRLTSGQRSGGFTQATENKATSIPIVGDAIIGAQKRSVDDYNRVVADEVLSSIGSKLPKNIRTGRDSVSHVYDEIGKSYDATLSKMTGVLDQQFDNDKISAFQRLQELPKEKADQTQRIIDNAINLRLKGNIVKAGDNKEIMRRLREKAGKYSKSTDPDQQLMGEIIQDVHTAYSEMLGRNNPPELADKLKATDLAFAKYVRLEQAALQGKDGIFTPAQMLGAVKKTDGSVRKGQFARGDSLLQGLAEAGNNVLPNTYPDSGSVGRAGLAALIAGGANVFNPALLPYTAAGALSAAAYTPYGQTVLRNVSKTVRKTK